MWLFFLRIRKAPVVARNATDAPLMKGRVFLKIFLGVSSGNSFRPFPWTFHCFLRFGDVFRFNFSASLLLCFLLLLCFSLFFDSILSCFSAVCFFFPLLCFSFFRFSVFLASLLLCLFASLRFLLVCFSFAFFTVLFPVIRKESGYLQNLTKSSKNLPNISSTRFLSIPVWAKDWT